MKSRLPGRRDFLHGVSKGAAWIAVLPMAGCGGGESPTSVASPAPAPPPAPSALLTPNPVVPTNLPTGFRVAAGTVDAALPTGLLALAPLYMNSPVVNGSFRTVVSNTATQAVIVTDGNGRGRALALSQVGSGNIAFDADSTALALAFLTLGIMTVDPAETTQRVASLRALSSFVALRQYIAANYLTRDLSAITSDASFKTLQSQVVSAFMAGQPQAASSPRLSVLAAAARVPTPPLETGLIRVDTAPGADPGKLGLSFSNFGWRYVTLLQRVEDAGRTKVGSDEFTRPVLAGASNFYPQHKSLVAGVNPVSWGNLFTAQIGDPGSATMVFDLGSQSRTAFIDYFVLGVGARFSSVELPPGASRYTDDSAAAMVSTLVAYVLGPMLDMFGMAGAFLEQLETLVPLIVNDMLTTAGTTGSLLGLEGALASNAGGTNALNVLAGQIDLILPLALLALAAVAAAAPAGTATAVLASTTVTFFAAVAGLAGLYNFTLFLASLNGETMTGVVEVPVVLQGNRYAPLLLALKVGTDKVVSINAGGTILVQSYDAFLGVNQVRLVRNGVDRVVLSSSTMQYALSNLNDNDHFAYEMTALSGATLLAQGFLFKNGGSVNLGGPGLVVTPLAINNDDTVVGFARAPNAPKGRFFISRESETGRAYTDLAPALPDFLGWDSARIDSLGHVALQALEGNPGDSAVRTSTVYFLGSTTLSVLGRTVGSRLGNSTREGVGLMDMNDSGRVLLFAYDTTVTPALATVWTWFDGVFTRLPQYQLGSFPGPVGRAITNAGQVVGAGVYSNGNTKGEYLAGLINYTTAVPAGVPLAGFGGQAQLAVVAANHTGLMVMQETIFDAAGFGGRKDILVLLTPVQDGAPSLRNA